MLLIFFTWTLLFILVNGFGSLGGKILRWEKIEFFDRLWLGVFLLIFAVMFYNLFFAVSPFLLIALIVLTALITAPQITRGLKKILDDPRERKLALKALIMQGPFYTIFAVAVALMAAPDANILDTYLYHYPAVRWFAEEPIVKGIVNLCFYLGYNSSFHALSALFDHFFWYAKGTHFMVGFFALLGVSNFFWDATRQTNNDVHRIFSALILFFLFLKCFGNDMNGLGPDVPLTCATLKTISLFLRREKNGDWHLLLLLGALGVSMKMSGAGLALGATLAYLFFGWRTYKTIGNFVQTCWRPLGMYTIFVLTMITRNIIATGHFFFPSPLPGLPLPWALSYDQSLGVYKGLAITSRAFDPQKATLAEFTLQHLMPSWTDIDQKFIYQTYDMLLPGLADNYSLLCAALLLPVWCLCLLFSKKFRQTFGSYMLILLIALPTTLVWFYRIQLFMRYAEGYIWCVMVMGFLPLVVFAWRRWGKVQVLALLMVGTLFTLNARQNVDGFSMTRYHLFGQQRGLIGVVPMRNCAKHAILPYKYGYLQQVYLATDSEQGCWACGASPLPCNEPSEVGIPLIDPDNFRKGFLNRKVLKSS